MNLSSEPGAKPSYPELEAALQEAERERDRAVEALDGICGKHAEWLHDKDHHGERLTSHDSLFSGQLRDLTNEALAALSSVPVGEREGRDEG